MKKCNLAVILLLACGCAPSVDTGSLAKNDDTTVPTATVTPDAKTSDDKVHDRATTPPIKGSGTGNAVRLASTSSDNANSAPEMTLVSLHVPGMTWPLSCTAAVRETLQAQPGVEKVNVDFGTQTARCQVDAENFDAQKAIEALAAEGFEKSTVKTAHNSKS